MRQANYYHYFLCILCLTLAGAGQVSRAADGPVQPPYSWRGIDGSGVFPAGDLVDEFWDLPEGITLSEGELAGKWQRLPEHVRPGARKNIVWRTLLPFWGFNTPVVMGDRVYLMTDEGWKDEAPQLLCLSAIDGKILWQQPVDHLDAWPQEKRDEAKKLRAIDQRMWREYMTWWNKLYIDPENDRLTKQNDNYEQIRAEAAAEGWSFPAQDKVNWAATHFWGHRGWWKDWGGDKALVEARERCREEHIFRRAHWTGVGPYFGSTMGSVVGDGTCIYAVTAFGGAVCYDAEGKLRWVTDLQFEEGDKPWDTHLNMASPVLADGHLVYYEHGGGRMHGVDCGTGQIAWQIQTPPTGSKEKHLRYRGHGLHMAPGGTPVVMRLGGPTSSEDSAAASETVVVANHGLAVRVRDGKLLGQVRMDNESTPYQSSYYSAVAHRDVLFFGGKFGPLEAIRLSIADDALVQEQVWKMSKGSKYDNRNVNLIYAYDRVYGGPLATKDKGKTVWFGALDASTGDLVGLKRELRPKGYSTGLAVTAERVIAKDDGYKKASLMRQRFGIATLPDLSKAGWGYLVPPPMPDEVRARHIAHLGRATGSADRDSHAWGHGGLAAWGNRIFIRNNDYLWCIGDPEKDWVPPEKYLKP